MWLQQQRPDLPEDVQRNEDEPQEVSASHQEWNDGKHNDARHVQQSCTSLFHDTNGNAAANRTTRAKSELGTPTNDRRREKWTCGLCVLRNSVSQAPDEQQEQHGDDGNADSKTSHCLATIRQLTIIVVRFSLLEHGIGALSTTHEHNTRINNQRLTMDSSVVQR